MKEKLMGGLVCASLLAACDDPNAGSSGRVIVRANGGNEARDGIARERFADGYAVRYQHAILSVASFHLRTTSGDDADVAMTPTVVDLVPNAVTVLEAAGVGARRWDEVGFQSLPVTASARNVNAPPDLVQTMVERGYSFLQTGTLTAPDGRVVPFALGVPAAIDYFRCTSGDGTLGVVVPASGTADVEITWHLTHAWFDSFAEDSAYRAEAVAAAYDGLQPVTSEQLASQPLARLHGANGGPLRDTNGNPVVYIPPQEPGVSTLRDFFVRTRFGHFNGLEGACQTEVTVATLHAPARPSLLDAGLSTTDAGERDASLQTPDAAGSAAPGKMCRTFGACTDDAECCSFCHDHDHCH